MNETLRFKKFVSDSKPWDTLFTEACRFASEIGRDRVVGVSHSEDSNEGVVVVWFWSDGTELPGALSIPEPMKR